MISYIFSKVGDVICDDNVTDGDIWPKTPAGATVINQTCTEGRIGYKSRTCIGPTWQPVFFYCINQQLNAVSNDANVSMVLHCVILKTACLFLKEQHVCYSD